MRLNPVKQWLLCCLLAGILGALVSCANSPAPVDTPMKQVYVAEQTLIDAELGLKAAKARLSASDYDNATSIAKKAGAVFDNARIAAKEGRPVDVYLQAGTCLTLQVGAYYGKNPQPVPCPEAPAK